MAEFLALRCIDCSMFQVKQRKKSTNKWCCSVCNEKQSIIKVYGSSAAAKDMRELVQRLNQSALASTNALPELHEDVGSVSDKQVGAEGEGEAKSSKWDKYLELEDSPPLLPCNDGDLQYVTSLPDGARKRRKMDHDMDHRRPLKLTTRFINRFRDEGTQHCGTCRLPRASTIDKENVPVMKGQATAVEEQRINKETSVRESSSKWTQYLEAAAERPQRSSTATSKWSVPQDPLAEEIEVQTELADEVVLNDDIYGVD